MDYDIKNLFSIQVKVNVYIKRKTRKALPNFVQSIMHMCVCFFRSLFGRIYKPS